MFVKTLEDKVVNLNEYKLLKIDTCSEAHGTSYALMVTDYDNSECLGCWETEVEAQAAIGSLTSALMNPTNSAYLDLSTRCASTAPPPEPPKKK